MTTKAIGLVVLAVGCTQAPADHKLPSASITPHLDTVQSTVACGDDIALYGATTPDVRYTYTYNPAGQLAHADGVYSAGGTNDAIDYAYDGAGNFTHMVETHGFGDSQVEITADYDPTNGLLDYTWDYAGGGYHDQWSYAFSSFIGPNQPTRETVSEQGQGSMGYTLDWDATGRITQAVPDSGSAWIYAYDDAAGTITVSADNGAWTDVVSFDPDGRELSEVWGGSDPQAIDGSDVYAWDGDALLSATYSSGTEQQPQQLQTVEVDTLRYDCSNARRVTRAPVHLGAMRARQR